MGGACPLHRARLLGMARRVCAAGRARSFRRTLIGPPAPAHVLILLINVLRHGAAGHAPLQHSISAEMCGVTKTRTETTSISECVPDSVPGGAPRIRACRAALPCDMRSASWPELRPLAGAAHRGHPAPVLQPPGAMRSTTAPSPRRLSARCSTAGVRDALLTPSGNTGSAAYGTRTASQPCRAGAPGASRIW